MKYSIKFIKEDALTQPAIVSGNTTQAEMDNQNDEQTQVDNQVAAVTPTLQAQDVDGLEDKDVMNYVYFNAPQDIDDNTRNALFSRADQIRQKQMNGSMTPKDQEVFAKGVISAATAEKNKATMGESYTSGRGGSYDEPDYPTSFYADDDETDFESFVADLAIATAEELAKEVYGDTDDITGWVYHMAMQPQYKEFMRERWSKHSVWSGDEPSGADILKFKKLIYQTFIEKFSK